MIWLCFVCALAQYFFLYNIQLLLMLCTNWLRLHFEIALETASISHQFFQTNRISIIQTSHSERINAFCDAIKAEHVNNSLFRLCGASLFSAHDTYSWHWHTISLMIHIDVGVFRNRTLTPLIRANNSNSNNYPWHTFHYFAKHEPYFWGH